MPDKTANQESAQALMCAILDYYAGPNQTQFQKGGIVLPNNIPKKNPYDNFVVKITKKTNQKNAVEDAHKVIERNVAAKLIKVTSTYNDIRSFLNNNPDWFYSSVYIANALYNQLTKLPGDWKGKINATDLNYYRGDVNVMNRIQKLFSIVNNQDKKFENINRWSPADIYFGAKGCIEKLIDLEKKLEDPESGSEFRNWSYLNSEIGNLVNDNSLLPVSLKKASSKDVMVKFFNVKNLHLKNPSGIVDQKKLIVGLYMGIPKSKDQHKLVEFRDFYKSISCTVKPKITDPDKKLFTSISSRIRDKGGATDDLKKWSPNMQQIINVSPATSMSGGSANLDSIFGLSDGEIKIPKTKDGVKKFFADIVDHVANFGENNDPLVKGTKIQKDVDVFLKDFASTHRELRLLKSEISGDIPEAPPGGSDVTATAILMFYLKARQPLLADILKKKIESKKKTSKQKGKPEEGEELERLVYGKDKKLAEEKKNIIHYIALCGWLYSKYYCMKYALKLLGATNDKKKEILSELFLGGFSISKYSSFFTKVGQ